MEEKLSQRAQGLAFQELKKQQEKARIEQQRILSKNGISCEEDKNVEDMFDMFDWSMSSNLTYDMASDIEPDIEAKISERSQNTPSYNSLNSSLRSNCSRVMRDQSSRSIRTHGSLRGRSSDRMHAMFQWGSNSSNFKDSASLLMDVESPESSGGVLQLNFQ